VSSFLTAYQASRMAQLGMWDPKVEPYRVSRFSRVGSYGWDEQNVTCSTEKEAVTLAEDAAKIPRSTKILVEVYFQKRWKRIRTIIPATRKT
jgi:hypothetical protein